MVSPNERRQTRATAPLRGWRDALWIAVLPAIFMLPITLFLGWRLGVLRAAAVQEQRQDAILGDLRAAHEQLVEMRTLARFMEGKGSGPVIAEYASARRAFEQKWVVLQADAASESTRTSVPIDALQGPYAAWAHANAQVRDAGATATPTQWAADARALESLVVTLERATSEESEHRTLGIEGAERTIRFEILGITVSSLLAAAAVAWASRRSFRLAGAEQQAEIERVRHAEARLRADQLALENERIATASRIKSEFVANMSHELRTPLTVMVGFTELLRDGHAGPITPAQADCLDHMLTNGRHLTQIIGDVLDLAKVEAGEIDLAPTIFEPAGVVREVCGGLQELFDSKGVALNLDLSKAPQRIALDPLRLRQVLYNFLSNALKFTPSGGRVSVRLKSDEDGFLRLEVTDTGAGIAPSDIPKLFTRFGRLDATAGSAAGGSGLGLFLTKRLVEMQGGRVGVESVPGEGSTFFAILPDAGERSGPVALGLAS